MRENFINWGGRSAEDAIPTGFRPRNELNWLGDAPNRNIPMTTPINSTPEKTTILSDYESLAASLRRFVEERDWDQFHTARNLAISLSLESAELLEHFQWSEKDPLNAVDLEEIQDEAADVLLYLMLLSDRLGFNLIEAGRQKIFKNKVKYPVEKSKGSSLKYDKLGN